MLDPLMQLRIRPAGIVGPAQNLHLGMVRRVAKTYKYGHDRNQRILLAELPAMFLDKAGEVVGIGIGPRETVQRSILVEIVTAKTVVGNNRPNIVDMYLFTYITFERLGDLRISIPIDTGTKVDRISRLVQCGE